MSYEIVTAGFCPQYWSLWHVKGSKGKTYTVTLDGVEHAPSCTCPAFKYSGGYGDRDCKHVRSVWEHGCLYNPQFKDPGPNDYAEHGIELVAVDPHSDLEPCPGCGQPMIAVKIAV